MTDKNNAELLLYKNIPLVNTSNGYGQKILRPEDAVEKIDWNITIDFITGLVPIIKCFNQNNEEILADIKVTLPQGSTKYTIENIPYYVNYLMVR